MAFFYSKAYTVNENRCASPGADVLPNGYPLFAGLICTQINLSRLMAAERRFIQMTLDRNSLKRLLVFSNSQIRSLIEKFANTNAGEGGLDVSRIDTSDEALNELRNIINTATDRELQEALDTIIKQARNNPPA